MNQQICQQSAERANKPNSVTLDTPIQASPAAAARPVSRSETRRVKSGDHLSGRPVTKPLKRPTHSSNETGRLSLPIGACWRWGLPCRRSHPQRGALLPHLFTLTLDMRRTLRVSGSRRQAKPGPHVKGGMFSVALSLGSRRVAVSNHRALPSSDFPPDRRGNVDRATASPAPPAQFYHITRGCQRRWHGDRFRDPDRVREDHRAFWSLTARHLCGLRACFWIAEHLGCGPQKGGPP